MPSWRPWLIVALGFLVLALAYSARASLSLIMPVWDQELGWSRSFISSSAAMALVVMGVLAPVGGRLVDLQGPRNTLVIGLAALALGCFVIAATDNQAVFFIAFGGISGIGFGLVAMHVVSTAVEQRFERNAGLAIGIASSGSGGGQFVIVPLIAVMLAATSWRWSFASLGVASLVLIVCTCALLPRERSDAPPVLRGPRLDVGLLHDLRFVLRKPAFHVLFWSYVICGYTTTGVIETHFLPYASFCGFAPLPSASAYGLLSAVNLAGMILAGWLADRANRPLLLGGIYLVRALSFVLLINIGAEIETLLVFSALFGLVDYSTLPVTASLVASHIGMRVLGLSLGLIMVGHSLGGAVGAYLGGVLFDLYLQYDWVWWSSVWISALAGVLVLLLRDDARPQEASTPA